MYSPGLDSASNEPTIVKHVCDNQELLNIYQLLDIKGLPGGSDSKAASNVGDLALIPVQEDPLEKGMATHSGILAWKIPRTEESGRLQSMGSQRIRHN